MFTNVVSQYMCFAGQPTAYPCEPSWLKIEFVEKSQKQSNQS